MSESVYVSLLLVVVCILQTASASAIRRTFEKTWHRRDDAGSSQVALERRQGQQHAISRDTTVEALLYTLEHRAFVRGMTTIDEKLFVVLSDSNTIRVYDTGRPDHPLVKNISVPGLINPNDINFCGSQHVFYIADIGTGSGSMHRLDRNGQVTSWTLSAENGQLYGMSVDAASCSVTVAYLGSSIQEFTSTGSPGPLISVELHPFDVVRLSDDRYLVSGFSLDWDAGRVALVDGSGHVLQSDSGYVESGSLPLRSAYSLVVSEAGFVIAVDELKNRVVLLDPSLRYIRELVGPLDGIRFAGKIWLDEGRGRLYVGHGYTVSVYSLT